MTAVNLVQLIRELRAAGLYPAGGLVSPDGQLENVHGLDIQGLPAPLSPEVQAVVDAHIATPNAYEVSDEQTLSSTVHTGNDVLTEAFRMPTAVRSIYRSTINVTGIDRGTSATWSGQIMAVFKRISGTVVQVGTRVLIANFKDATVPASWDIQPGVSGTDFIVSVKGAIGSSIDWFVEVRVFVYSPDGVLTRQRPPLPPPPQLPVVEAVG
jgi:hypothetical protein